MLISRNSHCIDQVASMVLPSFLSNNAVWIHGSGIVVVLMAMTGLSICFWRSLLFLMVPLWLFTLYFFRVPQRICHEARTSDRIIVCPADGRIVDVQYDERSGFDGYAWKIAIFLSPIDVHVNWVPTAGIIERIVYRPGACLPAFLPKSSELNERADIYVRTLDGVVYRVRQIAGAVARRIVCWVHEGDAVNSGSIYGMIRFGSRVEIFLPRAVSVDCGIGERVYGGSTVLGRWL